MNDSFEQLRKKLTSRRSVAIAEADRKFHKALLLAGAFDRRLRRHLRLHKHGIQLVKPGTPFQS